MSITPGSQQNTKTKSQLIVRSGARENEIIMMVNGNGCIFTSAVLEGEKATTKEKNDCCKLYLSSTVCSLDWADGLHLSRKLFLVHELE